MKLTDIDLTSYNNKQATIHINNLAIGVTIKSARLRYGHLDLLVTPIAGTGEKWMESSGVKIA